MTYGLDQFVKDIKTTLKADNGPGGRKAIRDKMELLLQNKEFLAKALPPDVTDGHRKLYEDADQHFVVLAHFHVPRLAGRQFADDHHTAKDQQRQKEQDKPELAEEAHGV